MHRSTLFWTIVLIIVFSLSVGTGVDRGFPVADRSGLQVQQCFPTEQKARKRMVAEQLAARGIDNLRVLDAMRTVPRHQFVLPEYEQLAYADTALPIGFEQTISQPYIVALMTELAAPLPEDRVLEIGTGSGYQAAVISQLVASVYTIEIIPGLADRARLVLDALGVSNIHIRVGDGYAGWPEAAPFDIILVTAAPETVPQALLDQLAPGGRMVIPVGPAGGVQELIRIRKTPAGILSTEEIIPVRFVPMVTGSP